MPILNPTVRGKLENTVKAARLAAEEGARAALEALAVHEPEPYSHMDLAAKRLRNQLRAHAKQLGDPQTANKGLALRRIVHECAYEHWHRMLFARFLAENHLLVEPDSRMAISLEECGELAAAEGTDLWQYASRCAQRMLPQIFRPHDPLLQVSFAPEHRLRLESLLAGLDTAAFTSDDALGWVYQYWRADEKDTVNKAGDKINADTLPAVTQLFTEHYMVEFLLHNTLGAWWAGKRIEAAGVALPATSEEEARRAVALPGVDWTYLRFTQPEPLPAPNSRLPASFVPAAGTFPGWPRTVRELRVMDPCCGSGHFLVALLHLLVAMRQEEEGLAVEEAVRAVLAENLHGLEIDARCSQLAAFNVALAAWKLIGRPVELPPLHIACSGLAVGSTKEEWLKAVEGTGTNLRFFLGQLYDLFQRAPDLGSLINPARLIGDSMHADKLPELLQLLDTAFAREEATKRTLAPEEYERGVAAQGMARAAQLLAGRYHLTVTNVPYLGRGNQETALRDFIQDHYPSGKADLATAFVLRGLEFCTDGGTTALVTPQNWLFLGSYKHLRLRLLQSVEWNVVARLGAKAFQTPMWDFSVVLLAITRKHSANGHTFFGTDVSNAISASLKASALPTSDMKLVHQAGQLQNPDSRVGLLDPSDLPLLRTRATCVAGVLNGDSPRFIRTFWEVSKFGSTWVGLQSTVDSTQHYGGREQIVFWEDGNGQLRSLARELKERLHDADTRGNQVWGKWGVAVSQMGRMPVTLYSGEKFDSNVAVIGPGNAEDLAAIWSFASSQDFGIAVRSVDQKLNVTNATLAKVPFDLSHWQKVAAEKYPNGLPKPHSDDPTQWLFSGHPCGSENSLQVAMARLLGYRWPRQTGSAFSDCPALGPDGLEKFADEDGIVCLSPIQGEPPAADRLHQLLAAAFGKEWSTGLLHQLLAGVGFAESSLEDWLRDGFFDQHCALFHQRPFIWHIWDGLRGGFSALVNYHRLCEGPTTNAKGVASQSPGFTELWESGPTKGIEPQRGSVRVREPGPAQPLQGCSRNSSDAPRVREPWAESQCPVGAPSGNHAGRKLLEKLTYTYLGEWIARQQDAQRNGAAGADDRLASALELKQRLEAILKGEPPFDLFVRWKPLYRQAIGWEPDINDGVRLNLRPFLASDLPNGKRGAGILRTRPNVKWEKDRGKEPRRLREEFPWFWDWDGQSVDFAGGEKFTGDRWNDCHYSTKVKQEARAKAS